MDTLSTLTEQALGGLAATTEALLEVARTHGLDEICEAADRVRRAFGGPEVDTCSIVNARSGRCPEDCQWCAQSVRHHTGVKEYALVTRAEVEEAARRSHEGGVKRFSLVTSGRRVQGRDIEAFCDHFRAVACVAPGLKLCASMGLVGPEELRALRQAGVTRYHCNLESSARFFPRLCSTHTHADKLRTIAQAREAGLEVCCGGIIGMGETLRDRLDMVAEAREAGAVSIPVNILNPIPGTPLGSTPLIGEEEIILTIALMKLAAPRCVLRFAGGRARLSRQSQLRILRGGLDGALMGDMLTTVGSSMAEDREMFGQVTGNR